MVSVGSFEGGKIHLTRWKNGELELAGTVVVGNFVALIGRNWMCDIHG